MSAELDAKPPGEPDEESGASAVDLPPPDVLSAADVAALHLTGELAWLRVLLNVHTRRMQRAGLLPGEEEDPGAGVGPDEVRARLRRKPHRQAFALPGALSEKEQAALAQADRRRERGEEALRATGHPLPLRLVGERFGLSEADRFLLLLAVANEVSPDFPRIFAFLNGRPDRPFPTLSLVMDCLVPSAGWLDLRERLDPTAPLLRHRLLAAPDDDMTTPWPQRALAVTHRVLRFLAGDGALSADLAGHAELVAPDGFPDSLLVSERDRPMLERAKALVEARRDRLDTLPLIVLRGAEGSGRHRWAHALSADVGRSSLVVDLVGLAAAPGGLAEGLRVALREARLQNALLALRNWDLLVDAPTAPHDEDGVSAPAVDPARRLSLALAEGLRDHPDPVLLLVGSATSALPILSRGVEVFELSLPDTAVATELWARRLPAERLAPDVTPRRLAESFRLTPGQLAQAAAAGLRELEIACAAEARLDLPRLQTIVKNQLRHRLGDIATLVTHRHRWEDLVVNVEVLVQLRELVSRHRNRHKVLTDWEFSRRFGESVGISALFDGPPGTGKTMAAGIVAGELGLDLFQVDLSRVISKYVGETEKQLANLFDEAERAGAILLFDEADSLFSKRTQVNTSNDRYANLKVNFLLQRIERFGGIAILTTNFPESMDEAFGRRVTMRVKFEPPDKAARQRIWETMLVKQELLADDVELEYIAEDFELSGGLIRNAVLRAAYMAAARGSRIDDALLRLAARIELRNQGKIVVGDVLSDLVETWGA